MTRRRVIAVLCSAGVIAGGWSATAGARTLAPLNPNASATTAPTTSPLRDRVLRARPAAARARSASTPERAYRAADGTMVAVALSDSFAAAPENLAAVQSYVDFLGSRLHGSELNQLHVFIGSPDEVNRQCGGGHGILACYVPLERRMYVPSQDPTVGQTLHARVRAHPRARPSHREVPPQRPILVAGLRP